MICWILRGLSILKDLDHFDHLEDLFSFMEISTKTYLIIGGCTRRSNMCFGVAPPLAVLYRVKEFGGECVIVRKNQMVKMVKSSKSLKLVNIQKVLLRLSATLPVDHSMELVRSIVDRSIRIEKVSNCCNVEIDLRPC